MPPELRKILDDHITKDFPEANAWSYVAEEEINEGWKVEVQITSAKLSGPRTVRFFVSHEGDVTPGRIQGSGDLNLKAQLADDLKAALRDKDEPRKIAIRLTLAAIKTSEVEKGSELDDAAVLAQIAKQAKQRKESIDAYEKAGRQDLVAKEESELTILQAYLPKQLSREELTQAARDVIAEVGAGGPADKGKVMPVLIKRLAGRAEGREINEVVTEILASL